MSKFIAFSALAAVLILSAAADANAWSRHGTLTGPRGTSTVQGSGSCANGTCSRGITRTGPYGGTISRQGTVSCNSAGTCTGSRQTTGPRGQTIVRQGSVSY